MSEALRTRDFWLLAGSFFVCGFTSNGLIGTHLIPHALEHGFTCNVAAGALALIGAFNVVGTICSGYLTDRFNPRICWRRTTPSVRLRWCCCRPSPPRPA